MRINQFKAWRQVVIPAAWTVFFIIIGIMVYLIPSRLDEQHKAQERYIQAYQQDLKREAKDNE